MLAGIRNQLGSALAGLDGAVGRLARAATTWAAWPAIIAVGAGAGAWAMRYASRLPQLDTNKLPEADRNAMVRWVVAAFAGVWLLHLGVTAVRRVRTGSWRLLDTVTRLNRALAPLAALPVVAVLRMPGVEKDSPKLTLLLMALAAAVAGYGIYAWGRTRTIIDAATDDVAVAGGGSEPKLRPFLSASRRFIAGGLVAGLWAAYGWFFSKLAITNHHALVTRTTDLGYYDNIFYQSIHGHPLGCSFIRAGYHGSAHFDPLLVLLSPIYLVYPRAELLLVLQSIWLGAGVVPMYLLAEAKLKHRLKALLLALAWAIYPALHGATMYEFHSLSLISPLLVWLLYFYETGKYKAYWGMLALLLLCREDVALLMCFVGLYALLDLRVGKARIGWITIVASLAYFVTVKNLFMTSSDVFMTGKDSYSFAYYYEEMMPNNKTGLTGIVKSLVTNPVFAIELMLEEAKILYVVQLFLPLAFLPLLARPGRWMLVYGFFFCLLASRDAVFSIHFQYSSVLFPLAFALTPIALARLEEGPAVSALGIDGKALSRAALGAAVVASLLVSWKFGGIVDNAVFKGGFARVARTMTPQQNTTYAWVREQVAKIPPNASVGATNRLGAHISNRRDAYFYTSNWLNTVQYAFIDEGELKGKDQERHKAAVATGNLIELGRHGRMALFQRKPKAVPPSGERPADLGTPTQKVEDAPPPDAPGTDTGGPDEDPARGE